MFSIASRRSWGVGEIPDLVPLSRWLERAGFDFVQFLPLNEMQEGQSSPYSALSAMALDPLFIALEDLPEWTAAGQNTLDAEERAVLEGVRPAPRVNYTAVRALKTRALRHSFKWFDANLWGTGDRRAQALRAFEERESWWLDDFALFRALHDANWPFPKGLDDSKPPSGNVLAEGDTPAQAAKITKAKKAEAKRAEV